MLELPLLKLAPGEIHAIIGESGSGKTLTLSAIMGLLPSALKAGGHLWFGEDTDLLTLDKKQFPGIRGSMIGMVFQEPMTALNPQMTCGKQLRECLPAGLTGKEALHKSMKALEEVGLTDSARFYKAYPHQISGGQRQRVMIAMATINSPRLVLADEPTTALDSITEREIMELLSQRAKSSHAGLILVTHNLALVQRYCNSMSLLRKGKLLQQGKVEDCFEQPHAYLAELLTAMPKESAIEEENRQATLEVDKLAFKYPGAQTGLEPVSFELAAGETLCVVGLSGSGKTTLAKILTGLLKAPKGEVRLANKAILNRRPTGVQMVFQDPYSSLNTFQKNLEIVIEPMLVKGLAKENAQKKAKELIAYTGLDASVYHRTPKALSGGQRQRLCIARALASEPEVLILDEAVAALDPLVQKQILDLLQTIRTQTGMIYLFITHNMAVARALGNKFLLLENGEVVFYGTLSQARSSNRVHPLLNALAND